MGQYIKSVFDLPSSVSYSMKKMMEVMLVNGLKKPKPLYNVCPKTMLLSILQRTLSIHQVQLLTSLEQTKNSKHTHTHEQKSRKKPCWDNVVLHGPTKQFTTYHPQYTTGRQTTAVLSQGDLDVKQFQNISCIHLQLPACCSLLPGQKFVPFAANLFNSRYHIHCI